MEITNMPGQTRLQFRLNVGVDDEGETILRTRSFGRIKPDATDEDIYEVGDILMTLQKHSVFSVHRFDSGELVLGS